MKKKDEDRVHEIVHEIVYEYYKNDRTGLKATRIDRLEDDVQYVSNKVNTIKHWVYEKGNTIEEQKQKQEAQLTRVMLDDIREKMSKMNESIKILFDAIREDKGGF